MGWLAIGAITNFNVRLLKMAGRVLLLLLLLRYVCIMKIVVGLVGYHRWRFIQCLVLS